MRAVFKRLISLPLTIILVALVAAMILALFFGAPAMAVLETVDMLRMRATTQAIVTGVGVVTADEGSRPKVAYQYTVNGTRYVSRHYAPGWWANGGTWTGGGSDIKRRFKIAQAVLIHYQPANPGRACLEYGWFKWSIGFSLAVWGMVFSRFAGKTKIEMRSGQVQQGSDEKGPPHIPGIWRRSAGNGMMWSGGLLVFFAPDILPVTQVGKYLAEFLAVTVLCTLYQLSQRRAVVTPDN
ncbi:MAG TPA: DUF3592 domain-containing protein [Tepidisphaeraceae bacterium]|nr:DUF3592 domain-containing protein [Tepidisphaeraceae bacterium]